jgi:ligand-binding sensor domain-containing protein
MRITGILLPIVLALTTSDLVAQTAIGQWQDHFQYRKTIAVVQGNADIYCATTTAVFKYSPQSGETERYTKVNALSDVNIQSIGWNNELSALVVGYRNGNLDVIRNGASTNLQDIKRSSIIGDKGIYCVANHNDLAYLGCGFGIVVVDLARMEVRDTWRIGPNAAQLQVNGITFQDDSIYAATEAGVFAAWAGEPNLAAYSNWHMRTDLPGAGGNFSSITSFAGHLVVNRRLSEEELDEADTVYYFQNGWQVLAEASGDFIRSLTVSRDGTLLTVTGRVRVQQFDSTLDANVYYGDNIGNQALNPIDAVENETGGIWVATTSNGLVNFGNGTSFTTIYPNGPANNSTYRMSTAKGTLYVTTGGVSGNWGNEFRKDGIHIYSDGEWRTTDLFNDPLYASGGNGFGQSLNDPLAVQVDPEDGSHAFIGSWDDGLFEMRNGHVTQFFGPDNSSLQRFQNDASDGAPTQVGGLAYDLNGNLWVSNSNCLNPISVRLKNGNWYSFSMGSALPTTLLADLIVGNNGYKWVIRPRGQGLLVFSDNGTPTDPGDDHAITLSTLAGNGHLPSNDVFSIAEDQDFQIWVGTDKGVAVFYNPDAVFTSGDFDAQQILIEQDGNVQILLETEAVTAIAVDGANRKWLGTRNSGLFLVSADGTEQVHHFTAANSPLPSDNITCLAIDGSTGEVFIGTDQGIVSYRSDATTGSLDADCTTVFPNPVRDTYTGPVAITGLVRGSDVRITDVAGNLVYRTTSLGGQAIWPVTDMSGRRVSTGVYLVFSVDPDGTNKCNTKVAVVR